MARYVLEQDDGTGLLSMEALANMPVPMTIDIAGVVWDVLGWESNREAIRLKPRVVIYRCCSENRNEDGTLARVAAGVRCTRRTAHPPRVER